MNVKKFGPILEIALFAATALLLHLLFFNFFAKGREVNFRYSLSELYGFFCTASVIIVFILVIVKSRNIESVGNTFMLLTCAKMALAYLLLYPVLNAVHKEVAFEKANFFIVFAIFLTLETVVTIRMINKN